MCVGTPNRLPFGIHGRNAAPTPTGFAEIVSNDFPVLHKGAGFLPPCAAQVLERDYVADTRAPGPEESSRVDLFHLCFGCGVQIEPVQGKFRGQSAPNTAFTMQRQCDRDARAQGRVQRPVKRGKQKAATR